MFVRWEGEASAGGVGAGLAINLDSECSRKHQEHLTHIEMNVPGGDVTGLEDCLRELGDGAEVSVAEEDLLLNFVVVRDGFPRQFGERGGDHFFLSDFESAFSSAAFI